MVENLDEIFELQIKDKTRLNLWISKLREYVSNTCWKKSRNDYAELLLEQVYAGKLEHPFENLPPEGDLLNLPRRSLEPTISLAVISIFDNEAKPTQNLVRRQSISLAVARLHQQLADSEANWRKTRAEIIVNSIKIRDQAQVIENLQRPPQRRSLGPDDPLVQTPLTKPKQQTKTFNIRHSLPASLIRNRMFDEMGKNGTYTILEEEDRYLEKT